MSAAGRKPPSSVLAFTARPIATRSPLKIGVCVSSLACTWSVLLNMPVGWATGFVMLSWAAMGPMLNERSTKRGVWLASTPRSGIRRVDERSAKSKPTTQTATALQYPFLTVSSRVPRCLSLIFHGDSSFDFRCRHWACSQMYCPKSGARLRGM